MVLIDCDSTYPVELIPKMLSILKPKTMIVGARPMNSIIFVHRIGNLIHSQSINLLFGSKLTDANSGLRAFWVDDLAGKVDANGFDIEVDMTIKALKQGIKIKEIPIEYKARVGRSKILLTDGLRILFKIFKERFF